MPDNSNRTDHRLVSGVTVKNRIISEVRDYTQRYPEMPRLVSILIGDLPEASVYVRNQARGADRAGLPFEQVNWDGDIMQEACKARLLEMNDDPSILDIILQRPVPAHINVRSLQSAIQRSSANRLR